MNKIGENNHDNNNNNNNNNNNDDDNLVGNFFSLKKNHTRMLFYVTNFQ